MTPEAIERALRDLARHGRLVKDYPYRRVWRVEAEGEAFYLKFYPHEGNDFRKIGKGSLAMYEFTRLQWLQKAGVPAARGVSVLMGMTIEGQKGDAVVLEAIEPAMSLLELAQKHHFEGTPIPNHRSLVLQVIEILQRMGQAGMGHGDLHLGNFLVKEGKVYLIDAYPVHKKGMLLRDVLKLANSCEGVASRMDLQRGWNTLGPGGEMPRRNPEARRVYRKLMSRIYGDNRYFASLSANGWTGVGIRRHMQPRRWSQASQLQLETEAWQNAWAELRRKLEANELTALKRSRSGGVLETTLDLGGESIEVIIKRPRRRYWYRYLNEIGRGGRARRAWWKSWRLIYKGIPCAWPMLLMEQRTLGYVTDAVVVFEKIHGPTLADVDLKEMGPSDRETLFYRVGGLLRRLEAAGLYHWDAKSSNWMVQTDDLTGPFPLLVDVDGVRNNWGIGEGMRRLLLSLREHPHYTPLDSLRLCRGYAPFSPIQFPEEAKTESGEP